MKKLKKKGKVVKTEAGELLLANEEGQAFRADAEIFSFWQQCDGTVTSEDLTKEISQKTGQKESLVKEEIERIAGEMEKLGLMEFVE